MIRAISREVYEVKKKGETFGRGARFLQVNQLEPE